MKADGELNADTKVRSSKYLNNLIEQDHRGVKSRLGPMLGLRRFRTAAITIAGVELLHRIKKGSIQPCPAAPQRQTCARHLGGGAVSVIKCMPRRES
jgi:transposase-like protein